MTEEGWKMAPIWVVKKKRKKKVSWKPALVLLVGKGIASVFQKGRVAETIKILMCIHSSLANGLPEIYPRKLTMNVVQRFTLRIIVAGLFIKILKCKLLTVPLQGLS